MMGRSCDQVLQRAYSRPLEFKVYWVVPSPSFSSPTLSFPLSPRSPRAPRFHARYTINGGERGLLAVYIALKCRKYPRKRHQGGQHERHHNSQSECVSRLIDTNLYQVTTSTLVTISTLLITWKWSVDRILLWKILFSELHSQISVNFARQAKD